jgi:acyl transferase domain-containing protein
MGLGDGVAIVRIGCRFPGDVYSQTDSSEFMLRRGNGVVEVPAGRWDADRYYDPDPAAPKRSYTRNGGFLSLSPWAFDAEFFGISSRDTEVMDPHQRWALEVGWDALDDAGIAGVVPGRNVGVYVGGFTTDNLIRRYATSGRHAVTSSTSTGTTLAMVSNRLSRFTPPLSPTAW